MRNARTTNLDLASLLAPIDVEEFFARYWEQEPLVIARNDPSFYAGLPTNGDFEFLLSSLTHPRDGWFSLVKVQARPPDHSMLSQEGLLNLAEVYGAYKNGFSLLLNQVQKRHRATGVFCRGLEIDMSRRGVILSRHVGANAYLSPSHSQGFSIHYDPHDVFILQLEGRKQWTIYGRHVEFPLDPPASPIPREEAGTPLKEFELEAGDFIYIPRGFLHEARSGDESSLHLTLILESATWRDLLGEMLVSDPRFRQALPRHFGIGGAAGTGNRRALAARASALANSPQLGAALSRVTGRLLTNLDSLPNGGFHRVEDSKSLRASTWVGLADGVFGRIEVKRDSALLHLPGTSLSAPRFMAPAFRFLLKAPAFRASDLPVDAVPREKLEFVRGLVSSGFLVRRPKPAG